MSRNKILRYRSLVYNIPVYLHECMPIYSRVVYIQCAPERCCSDRRRMQTHIILYFVRIMRREVYIYIIHIQYALHNCVMLTYEIKRKKKTKNNNNTVNCIVIVDVSLPVYMIYRKRTTYSRRYYIIQKQQVNVLQCRAIDNTHMGRLKLFFIFFFFNNRIVFGVHITFLTDRSFIYDSFDNPEISRNLHGPLYY